MSLLQMTRPVVLAGEKRVHRLDGDPVEDIAARTTPTTPTPAKETAMPRGKKAASDAPATPPTPGKRRGPKPGFKRTPKTKPVGAASFTVNDRGAMQIRDGQQVIDLERDDVARLEEFLANSKGLRK